MHCISQLNKCPRSYTCRGDSLLQAVMNDNTVHVDVSDYAQRMMGYTKLDKDQKARLKTISREELDTVRKEALQRFSDEAIEDLDMTTRLRRKESSCQ